MNCLEYFRQHFPNYDLTTIEAVDCSEADILEEMSIDSPCGLSCKQAIDAAVQLCNHISLAYGPEGTAHPIGPRLYVNTIEAAVEVAVCYIRG
jgi:hypothetical protein